MNIHQTEDDAFEFEIHNLLDALDGHYTFRWRRDGSYVMRQHGSYDSLTSYTPVVEQLREPTEAEKVFLAPRIAHVANNALFYDRDKPCGWGARLVPGSHHIVYAHLVFVDEPINSKICELL